MSIANKCDRCGKFFEESDFDNKPVLHVEKYVAAEGAGKYGYWKNYDLCPSCCRALEHFMKCEPFEMKLADYSLKCGAKHLCVHVDTKQ